MDFYVVADRDTVVGFRYVGVSGVVVDGPDEARAELERLRDQRAELIVITTERIAESVREEINALRYAEDLPLIVEIPGPEGPSTETPSLLRMIRDAVGIRF